MSRTKKAFKMVIGSIINQAMIVIAGLILPPLIIEKYGSATNGLVNSVKQVLNYFTIISVGLGAAGQIALYEPLAKNDNNKVNKIMSELSSFFNKMGTIFCILIGIFAFILPILRKGEIKESTIFLIVIICGIGSLIEFKFLQKYKILLIADQKQYISSSVNTQGILINLLFSVILIHFNAPIVIVQLMATLAYVVRMCLMSIKIKKLYPFLDLKVKSDAKQIPKQKDALIYKTTDIIINYAPMTIVTLMYGFVDASIYSVYNTIFMSIGMIVNIFSSGFSSSFGNLLIEKDSESFHDSFTGYAFAFRTLSFWLYCCAAILIIPFISVYIGNTDGINYLIPMLGILFALNGVLKSIRTPSSTIIDAIGKYSKKNILLNYIEVIINISVSIIISIKFGIVGVLVGGIMASTFRGIFFIIDVYKENVNESYIKEFMRIVVNLFVSTELYILFRGIKVNNYIEWIKEAIIVAIVCGLIIFIVNIIIDKKSFIELKKRIQYIIVK